MKNNKKKILIYSILGIITVLIVTLTITYAYWILTREQTGENVVNTACLNISFTGENDITLDKAYPMKPEQLENFLSTATPYHFTIHNECSELASATINLESLNAEAEKQLQDEYINAILYEDDYHANLNSVKQLGESIYNDENKVIEDSLHAYKLHSFTLKGGDTKEFNLLLYMDPETPMVETNMNAGWKGKITLSSEYTDDKFINAGTLAPRSVLNNNSGMWSYTNKLTKIEIQDEIKPINEGEVIYGPFDESEEQNKSVQSYVVCESEDANCIGYLQGDGGIKLPADSSDLFSGFINLIEYSGFSNVDTSNVTNMSSMFSGNILISNLDLSSFNTSKVTSVENLFSGATNLAEINLSNWNLSSLSNQSGPRIFNDARNILSINMTNFVFPQNSSFFFSNGLTKLNNIILDNVDTSNTTNMNSMFSGCSSITTLDLSDFDTENLESISNIFGFINGLQKLDLSNWKFNDNISVNFTSNTFLGAPSSLELILSNVDTSNVTNMSSMFAGLHVNTLDLSDFDTENVVNMSKMFYSTPLKELDLSNFDTHNVTDISNMFNGATSLQTLNLSNWNLSSLTSSPNNMFGSNVVLTTINMTNFVFPQNSSKLFSNMYNITNLILTDVNTSNTTDMSYMFNGLTEISKLDLSSFDTSNVTNFDSMLSGTTNLQTITFGPNFILKPEATTNSMFTGCNAPERPTDDSWTDVSFD